LTIAISPPLESDDLDAIPVLSQAGADNRYRLVWRISLGLVGLQLMGMLILSTLQYQRFNLTNDFAAYSQAWAQIAHGHLSPYSTLWHVPFWRNDLELFMWPLALAYWVYPHAVTLLWLQDLAVAGGEVVVLTWARDSLKVVRLSGVVGARIVGIIALLLLLTPWSWFTIGFDFHFEAPMALFGLLSARALYFARYRLLLVWVVLTLSCCAVPGALLTMAIGVAGIISRTGSRKAAFLTSSAGALWLLLAAGLGATTFGGLQMSSMYGYLAGHAVSHIGVTTVLEDLALHPLRALSMFGSRSGYVVGYLASGGAIGLASRWGLVPAVAVLVPSALNANVGFIHFAGAFQSWPAVLFLLVASGIVLGKLAARSSNPGRDVTAFGILLVAMASAITIIFAGYIPLYVERVSAGAAAALAKVEARLPAGAEVIASQGVIGRFGIGHTAYPYWAEGVPERYAVSRPTVVFIFSPRQGTAEGYPNEALEACRYARGALDATVIDRGSGIWVFIWEPKAGTRSVTLP
jgi:uncharacterized membrane protein